MPCGIRRRRPKGGRFRKSRKDKGYKRKKSSRRV